MEATSVQVPEALLAYIPAITILMQIFKTIPALQKLKTYFPIFAIILGIGAGYVGMPAETDIIIKVLSGATLGLASSGLFSGAKSVGTLGKAVV